MVSVTELSVKSKTVVVQPLSKACTLCLASNYIVHLVKANGTSILSIGITEAWKL